MSGSTSAPGVLSTVGTRLVKMTRTEFVAVAIRP